MRDGQLPRSVDTFHPMNGIGARIRSARKKAGLTQEALAARCGWEGNSRIGNYEKEIREPSAADMRLIAAAVGVNAGWLWTGDGPETGLAPVIDSSAQYLQSVGTGVPVIEFPTLADGDIREDLRPAKMAVSWTICPVKHGPRTFAFKMPDNSMACATDQSIPAGHYVWIDPEQAEAAHDSPVLARLESGQHLVAQLMEQAGRRWLHLLNPAYPPVPPGTAFEIVGRVIFSGRER